jgi:hypothetical protein
MNFFFLLLVWICVTPLASAQVVFTPQENTVGITVDSKEFATYVFQDRQIYRPYFHSLKSPLGVPVTRNHPPVDGVDLTDHADYHPGLWMAFGDLNQHDYWRNKSRVKHIRFLTPPTAQNGQGSFSVLNHYTDGETVVCQEECTIRIASDPEGVFLFWDSVFHSNKTPFSFGDQEEMGLGIRMATPLIVQNGGTMLNQHGHRNEKEVWGEQAPWCAYYGKHSDGSTVGALLMAAPDNFRESWFHARDYGLLTANPFGRKAFTDQEKSVVPVNPGERFPLRFGVYIFQVNKTSPEWFSSKYREYSSAYREM